MPALLAICLALAVAPPTDDEVRARIDTFNAWSDAALGGETDYSPEALTARADEVFDVLPIDERSPRQLAMLTYRNSPTMRTSRRAEVKARLAELARAPTLEGAHAAMILVMVAAYDDDAELLAAARAGLSHPALADAIGAGVGEQMFESLGRYVDFDGARSISDEILGITPALPDDAGPSLLASLATLVRMLAHVCTPDQHEAYHALRRRVLEIATRARATTDDPEAAPRIESIAALLDGAYARLELFGHPLPPTVVLWSSEPDLTLAPEGRVVVLEFFATWCASCIADFPAMRRFVERYEGYPVTLVGVSELQGWHYPPDAADRIDTSADPGLEYRLMDGFIRHHQMRWPVAFVPKGYLFQQLGVTGVPHGVILDAEGTVRATTPPFTRDYDDLCARIDALLREAGLPAPETEP